VSAQHGLALNPRCFGSEPSDLAIELLHYLYNIVEEELPIKRVFKDHCKLQIHCIQRLDSSVVYLGTLAGIRYSLL